MFSVLIARQLDDLLDVHKPPVRFLKDFDADDIYYNRHRFRDGLEVAKNRDYFSDLLSSNQGESVPSTVGGDSDVASPTGSLVGEEEAGETVDYGEGSDDGEGSAPVAGGSSETVIGSVTKASSRIKISASGNEFGAGRLLKGLDVKTIVGSQDGDRVFLVGPGECILKKKTLQDLATMVDVACQGSAVTRVRSYTQVVELPVPVPAPGQKDCPVCLTNYDSVAELVENIRVKHKSVVDCTYVGCTLSFDTKAKLQQHIEAIHEKYQPYKCSASRLGCTSKFNKKSSKVQHEKECVHLNPDLEGQKFQCDTIKVNPDGTTERCGVLVSKERYLNDHKKKCPLLPRNVLCLVPGCDKRFVSRYQRDAHMRGVHAARTK